MLTADHRPSESVLDPLRNQTCLAKTTSFFVARVGMPAATTAPPLRDVSLGPQCSNPHPSDVSSIHLPYLLGLVLVPLPSRLPDPRVFRGVFLTPGEPRGSKPIPACVLEAMPPHGGRSRHAPNVRYQDQPVVVRDAGVPSILGRQHGIETGTLPEFQNATNPGT